MSYYIYNHTRKPDLEEHQSGYRKYEVKESKQMVRVFIYSCIHMSAFGL